MPSSYLTAPAHFELCLTRDEDSERGLRAVLADVHELVQRLGP